MLVFNRGFRPIRFQDPIVTGRAAPWHLFYFSARAVASAVRNESQEKFRQTRFSTQVLDFPGTGASCLLFDNLTHLRSSGLCL